ncbi:hypothetical protein ACNHQI_11235 [Klebsiella quasipneumoniae]|uniref:hypothetical protein n=1 Tax=Klebsiella quasipneumoniae TaxID=1463165 RepID=UPI003A80D688
MTVSTEVDHNDYTGNGVTTSFPYTFRIFKKSDLTVQVADLNENITVLTLDTDYSVTGAGTYSGGNVVLMSPLANGWQISISRDLPVTQETDLRNQGKFFAEVHEDAFDKLTMLIQQCFSFLRLALRKPSFIANYYDALNNRIRNLRDPSQAQDAATKNYVDGQIVDNTNAWQEGDRVLDQKIDSNFRRSLRVPDSYVEALPLLSQLEGKILAFSGGRPIGVLPESGSAADVMIELADDDGYRHVGECSSISELRAVTLDYHGQKVKLRCWDMSQTTALIDVFYVYDATDTTSADDGYRTIVNAAGQRFKALLSDAIDLRIAGLRSYGDNLGTSFNRVLAAELARVTASGSAMKMATIKLPALSSFDDPNISTYNAILNASIVMPSFLPVAVDGNYFCKFNPTNDVALKITNSLPGVTPSLIPWRDMKSVKMFKNTSGHFELIGPGSTASQAAGLQIGNGSAGDSVLDLRGLSIDDIQIRAFRYGLDFIWNDTYILKFHNLELTGNYTNISSLIAGKVNSGENIRISESLIADSVSHQFNWNSPGIGLALDGCSTDYAGGSVFYLDNGARGNTIDYNGGHIEGWGGMLALQVAQSVAWYGYPNSLTFNGTQIKAAGNSPGVWASRRKILHSGVVLDELGTKVMFRDSPIYWPAPASEPHVALTGYTDPTPQYMRVIYNCPNSPYPDCLGSYRQSTNKGLYRFGGTEGNSVKGLVDSLTGFTFSTNGNPTIVYGGVDSDGLQHIIINFDATTTWVEICNKGLYYALEREAEINTALSVMMENITEGDLKLNTRFLYYYGAAKTYDGYEDGKTKSLTSLLTATYNGLTTPLTTSMYVGEQTALSYIRQDSAHPTQAEYVQPAIVLRGAKGQARIKLPAIWPTKGRGSAFVFS